MLPAKAIALLNKDVVFRPVVKACKAQVQHRFDAIEELNDVYIILLRSIVSQQLSAKAAKTIYGRFEALFKNNYPSPKEVLILNTETLRSVGLSAQKTSYIKAVAQYTLDNNFSFEQIVKLTNDELIQKLTSIKGVGRWTVEMILIFSLKRLDVFPYDDLVVRNQLIKLYGIKSKGKQLKEDCHAIAQQWKPYSTIASLFLWQSKDMV